MEQNNTSLPLSVTGGNFSSPPLVHVTSSDSVPMEISSPPQPSSLNLPTFQTSDFSSINAPVSTPLQCPPSSIPLVSPFSNSTPLPQIPVTTKRAVRTVKDEVPTQKTAPAVVDPKRMYRELFTMPTPEELSWRGSDFVGKTLAVFWDGDNTYYPADIVSYNAESGNWNVRYWAATDADGMVAADAAGTISEFITQLDEGVELFVEDLLQSSWKIWKGSRVQLAHVLKHMPEEGLRPAPAPMAKPKKAKQPTYSVMILETVAQLGGKDGVSLQAIRKHIWTAYEIRSTSSASFNNLTLKSLNSLLASGIVVKIKSSYKLSDQEKARRKDVEQSALQEARAREKDAFSANRAALRRSSGLDDINGYPDDDLTLFGAALAHNKVLRKELLEHRLQRDLFLSKHLDVLKPFLPEKNYFSKKGVDTSVTSEDNQKVEKNIAPADPAAALAAGFPIDHNAVSAAAEAAGLSIKEDATPDNTVKVTVKNKSDPSASTEIPQIPTLTSLRAELHPHQVVGISWLLHMYRHGMPAILGDEMGLGKTLQTIGYIAGLQELEKKKGPHLIVVPLSVVSNWMSEIERFCPSLRVVRFHGPKPERDRLKAEELSSLEEFDVVVTTFEVIVSEASFFRRRYVWTSLVVDEAHRLKNEKSLLSEKLRGVPCVQKVLLTGTPLQNNLHELWALLYFLSPDVFQVSDAFDHAFDLTRGIIENRVLRAARRLLNVFMLRRLKDEVSIKLPNRKETTVMVPLTKEQLELYKKVMCAMDEQTVEVIMNTDTSHIDEATSNNTPVSNENTIESADSPVPLKQEISNGVANGTLVKKTKMADSEYRRLLNLLIQLRKVCNHTFLLPPLEEEESESVAPAALDEDAGTTWVPLTEEIVRGSGKLLLLDRMLPGLHEDGHRVLIFSQFAAMLDILEQYCELRGYQYARLDGSTNRVQRKFDVSRFNAPNSPLFIYLISTRAGGLGLNLATADTVILYDSDWNPQSDLQAMDRAHRIGQKKPVRIFRLVCGGTVEERMVSRAEKKRYLSAMVAEKDDSDFLSGKNSGDGENGESGEMDSESAIKIGSMAMSKAELASLIRFGANAIVDSGMAGNEMSDEDLAQLLERGGRNTSYESFNLLGAKTTEGTSSNDDEAKSGTVEEKSEEDDDAFAKAQALVKQRMETLREVDLRQVGDVFLKRQGRIGSSRQLEAAANILAEGTKRERRQRIVHVSMRGSGYGSAVPMLAAAIAEDEAAAAAENAPPEERTKKNRSWCHRQHCTLCAKDGLPDEILRCGACPLVFHRSCVENTVLAPGNSTSFFLCAHHRCGGCGRSTSAAGGLLFRCDSCMTAFCEDCLPGEGLKTHGRCRPLEESGYMSRQAFFITCPPCVDRKQRQESIAVDGGVQMDVEPINSIQDHTSVEHVTEEGDSLLPTQLNIIEWDPWVPPPPTPPPTPPPPKKKRGRGKKVEEEEEEVKRPKKVAPPPPPPYVHPKLPASISLVEMISHFEKHPAMESLVEMAPPRVNKGGVEETLQDLLLPLKTKAERGRYRAVAGLSMELISLLERNYVAPTLSKQRDLSLRSHVHELRARIVEFLRSHLEPATKM